MSWNAFFAFHDKTRHSCGNSYIYGDVQAHTIGGGARAGGQALGTAPIIYTLEAHPRFARRFARLFARHEAGELQLAVTTVTIAEVLVGPLRGGEEALARRYRAVLEAWRVVELTADIAESAARLRGANGLKLPDAVQVASALAIDADALVTHGRDFAPVRGLRILG